MKITNLFLGIILDLLLFGVATTEALENLSSPSSSSSSSSSSSCRLEFRPATSSAEIALCQALRHQVFVQEQKVPKDAEYDGRDDEATHVLCYAHHDNSSDKNNVDDNEVSSGVLVGTGRFLLQKITPKSSQGGEEDDNDMMEADDDSESVYHAVLGRIAVLPSHRKQGIGRQIIANLEQLARQKGARKASLSPHHYLHDFYKQLGYRLVPNTGHIVLNEHCTLIRMEKWLE